MARSRSSSPQGPAPKSDVYVGLLTISLLAQVAGAVFFYLDWSSYPDKKPTQPAAITVQVSLPGGGDDGGKDGPPKDGGKKDGGKKDGGKKDAGKGGE